MLDILNEAADFVLDDVLRLPVRKALDPLNPLDFLQMIQQLAAVVKGITGPAEAAAMRAALSKLDVDWRGMTPAEIKRVENAANLAMRRPNVDWPKLKDVFRAEGVRSFGATKKSIKEKYGLSVEVAPRMTDQKVIDRAASSQINYVRDQYGVRADAASKRAREIVADGLEKGWGRSQIAENLYNGLQAQALGRAESYFHVVAAAHMARARSYASLSGYSEAGIEWFHFQSILDELTTPTCRFMHNRRFSVNAGLQRYHESEELEDPEDIKTFQPWIRSGKDEDGNKILWVPGADGSRNKIADVVRSGVGSVDDLGEFKTHHNDASLQSLGIALPPTHGNCRSSIIPDTSITVSAPAPPPRPRTPRQAPPPPTPQAPAPPPLPPPNAADRIIAPPPPGVAPPPGTGPNGGPIIERLARPDFGDVRNSNAMQSELISVTDARGIPGNPDAIAPEALRMRSASPETQRVAAQLRAGLGDSEQLARVIEATTPGEIYSHPVFTSGGVNRELLSEAVRSQLNGAGPVFIRMTNWELVALDARSEVIAMAARLRSSPIIDARIIHADLVPDLRAIMNPPPPRTPQQFGQALSDAFRTKDKAEIRRVLRGWHIQDGSPRSFDIAAQRFNAAGFATSGDPLYHRQPGVLAFHTWDGDMNVRPDVAARLESAAGKLARNEVLTAEERQSIHVLLHEESHGFSPVASSVYRGSGVAIEEVGTELLARRRSRALGLSGFDAPSFTARGPVDVGGGYYPDHMRNYFAALRKAGVPAKNIGERVENAYLRMRANPRQPPPATPRAYAVRLAAEMGDDLDAATRAKIIDGLSALPA